MRCGGAARLRVSERIADCAAYGLRAPEFIQAEDFRTIIWRKEKVSDPGEKVSKLSEKVTEQDEKVSKLGKKVTKRDEKVIELAGKSNQVRLTAKQKKVLEFCDETPRTAQEILDMLGVQNQNKTRQQYTTKLVLMGVLRPTTVHKNDSNRKYITAHGDSET